VIHIAWRVDTKRFTALNLRLYYLTWPRVFTGLQKIDVAAFLTSHFDNAMKYCNVACLWIFMPSLSTMHCDNYSNTATAPSWTRAQFSYGYCWCPSWPWCFPHFQWPHTVGSNGLGVYPLPELKVALNMHKCCMTSYFSSLTSPFRPEQQCPCDLSRNSVNWLVCTGLQPLGQ